VGLAALLKVALPVQACREALAAAVIHKQHMLARFLLGTERRRPHCFRNRAPSPDHMPDNENDLRRAKEIVAEAQRFVREQKGKIVRLKTAGRDTCNAEKTLQLFESNLKVFEDHRDVLQRAIQ
jgi:hypothetical protein